MPTNPPQPMQSDEGWRNAGLHASTPGVDGANLRELLAIMARRKQGIAVCALLFLALGLGYVIVTPKTFFASVSLLVDGRARMPLGAEPSAFANNTPDTALIESQVRLIASDAILSRVVERERLADDPGYGIAAPGLLTRLMGLSGPQADTKDDRAARALGNVRRNILVRRSDRTYVIDVDVTAADGPTAARLGNAIAAAYVADQGDAKLKAARLDGETLNTRLADLQHRLSVAEAKVQAYKAEHQIYDANGKRINEQELADGTTSLSAARAKTADAKARLDQIQRIIASGRPADAVTEALKSPAIDRLRGQYTDVARQEANYRTTLGERHPALVETRNQAREIKSLIVEELRRIAAGAANDYRAARDNEANVERSVGSLKKTADVTSQASIELRELEHDVDASKAVYDKFLRARETVGETGLDGPAARIIAPATIPIAASAPKAMPILALALASGLFVGIGQAFLREYIEAGAPRKNAPGQPAPMPVKAVANPASTSWIGRLLGWFRRKEKGSSLTTPRSSIPSAPVPTADAPQVDEDILSLWDELRNTAPRRAGAFTILVAAAEPGCDTSPTTSGLARAVADEGEHVLVLESDPDNNALRGMIDLAIPPQLIDLGGTLRPCYHLRHVSGAPIMLVPIMENEEQLVRKLLRQAGSEPIDGINGNFSHVFINAPAHEDGGNGLDSAAVADQIVLVTQMARLSPIQIRRNLAAMGCGQEKFGGLVCGANATAMAA